MTTATSPAPESPTDAAPESPRFAGLIRYAPLLMVLPVIAGLLILGMRQRADHKGAALPVYALLPEVRLVAQDGRPFAISDLRGRVFVADFIFTRCATSCPRITSRMKRIQDRIEVGGPKIRLVSISVDPTHDDPSALDTYARGYGAKPELWTFLTGPTESVQKAVVDGFKLPMAPAERDPKAGSMEPFSVLHSEKLVLVDASGAIRGYYESDDTGVERLLVDAGNLLAGNGA